MINETEYQDFISAIKFRLNMHDHKHDSR